MSVFECKTCEDKRTVVIWNGSRSTWVPMTCPDCARVLPPQVVVSHEGREVGIRLSREDLRLTELRQAMERAQRDGYSVVIIDLIGVTAHLRCKWMILLGCAAVSAIGQ